MIQSSAISFYKNSKDSTSQEIVGIDQFLSDIKTGKWKQLTEKIASITDKKERQIAKATHIPMVTLSGTFSHRENDKLIKHSGFICLDFDDYPPSENVPLIDQIWHDQYTYACFASISQRGFAVVVKIDPSRHLDAFEGLEKYYSDKYNIATDRSCKNISRTRYVSYDPQLWHNPKSNIFKKYILKKDIPKNIPPPIYSSRDFQTTIDFIESNRIDLTKGDYWLWLRIGFALADEFSENGRSFFHSVSQFNEKYNFNNCEKQYDACLKSRGSGIGIGTFFHYCKESNVPIKSEQTRTAIKATEQAKKLGRSKESAIKTLVELQGIDPLDASEIAQKTYERNYKPEPTNNPVESIELYLSNSYNLKRNIITGRIENNGKPMGDIEVNSMLRNLIKIEPKTSIEKFNIVLKSDTIQEYHPLKEFLTEHAQSISPTNIIKELASCIIGNNGRTLKGDYYPDAVELFIRKFLLGMIAGALGDETPPLLPVLFGKQGGEGKSRFWKHILPEELQFYYTVDSNKVTMDSDIIMAQKWLICIEEWGGKMQHDSKYMKNRTGQDKYTMRLAYGREYQDYKRLAMLCGTSNQVDILQDDGRNRRIIPINCTDIDWNRFESINKTELFIEAYHIYVSQGESCFLNKNENDLLDDLSSSNKATDSFKEAIEALFLPADPNNLHEQTHILELTALDIAKSVTEKYPMLKSKSPDSWGRILSSMDFVRERKYQAKYGRSPVVYYVIPVKK